MDIGQDPHSRTATVAPQDVDLEDASQKFGPRVVPGASGDRDPADRAAARLQLSHPVAGIGRRLTVAGSEYRMDEALLLAILSKPGLDLHCGSV